MFIPVPPGSTFDGISAKVLIRERPEPSRYGGYGSRYKISGSSPERKIPDREIPVLREKSGRQESKRGVVLYSRVSMSEDRYPFSSGGFGS